MRCCLYDAVLDSGAGDGAEDNPSFKPMQLGGDTYSCRISCLGTWFWMVLNLKCLPDIKQKMSARQWALQSGAPGRDVAAAFICESACSRSLESSEPASALGPCVLVPSQQLRSRSGDQTLWESEG